MRASAILLLACTLFSHSLSAQDVLNRNRYLRMTNSADAINAMRFDLAAYRDTLRSYRTALDGEITSISAIEQAEQDRRARLGSLREDVKALDKELKAARKSLRRIQLVYLSNAAERTELSIDRARVIRNKLVQEGIPLR